MSQYSREVLKVVVAKICQTIGWHSIQSTPLEIMVDILRRYLSELTKLTNAYATQFGHTQPNLDELGLAFRDMHINLADLEEYVRYVESNAAIEVPQFPVRKESHLNFLKPGSSEVVTRPVHIYEHLPPMLPESEEADSSNAVPVKEEAHSPPNADSGSTPVFKRPADISPNEIASKRPRLVMEEEGRPTREISSVMMTTSGFLSPAREGKLPEARTPINTVDTPSSSNPHSSGLNSEPRFGSERKGPRLVKDLKKNDKRKEKASKELFKPLVDEIAAKKFTSMKDVVKLKAMKANVANSNNANNNLSHANDLPATKNASVKQAAANSTKQTNKAQAKSVKNEKLFAPIPNPVPPKPPLQPDKVIEGKLSSEPDKSKLNIFKKISKVKDDKVEKSEKIEKVKIKDEPRTGDPIAQESRESSPDLIIDESDMKNWDPSKLASTKVSDPPIKQEPVEKPTKVIPPADVPNKWYETVKSPYSEKDFHFDDDISPPGTPSTPKTPEMPTHSPPLKTEKELKRKRKDKTKVRSKTKMPKYSMSPRRNKSEHFEELDRPKTPNDPNISNIVEVMPPPGFFFQNFMSGPGLIPTPMTNPLFPRMPLTAGLPKHGFGQPAHIPPAMPALPFSPPAKQQPQPVDEVPEKIAAPAVALPDQLVQPEKPEPVVSTKEKHKKDKKDKPKKKNKKDKIKNKSEKRKLKEEKKDKDKIKKEKREKKKEKEVSVYCREHEGSVPKLTLKIGSPRPPTPDVARKIMIKPVMKKEEEQAPSASASNAEPQDKREPSPELARISALITRPPKLKVSTPVNDISSRPSYPNDPSVPPIHAKLKKSMFRAVPKIKSREFRRAGEPEAEQIESHEAAQPAVAPTAFYVDNDGNKVWICPACGGQDDGSPMIGCDDCDAWYHWVCVGIQVPPDDNEDWYCRICIVKKQETIQMDKKKKRKKKERKEH